MKKNENKDTKKKVTLKKKKTGKTTFIIDTQITMIMDGNREAVVDEKFKRDIAEVIKKSLDADDVNVKNVKIFIHEEG